MSLAQDIAELEEHATHVCESIDVACLSASDAAVVLRAARRLEAKFASLKLACGKRAVDGGVPALEGARDGASWFAVQAGISVGEARSLLATASVLKDLEPVATAFAAGEVSAEQAREVAAASGGDAGVAKRLIEVARTSSMSSLKKSCRQASGVRPSAQSEVDRHERLRRQRYFRAWSDSDGMVCGRFQLLPEDGALLLGRLKPFTDAAFKSSYKLGVREAHDAYQADGFVALIETAGGERKSRKAEVVVIADYEALVRGYVEAGERCEVEGVGPVPVALVQQLRSDCCLSQIVTKDGKPAIVKGKGHYIPDKLRIAVKIRDGGCCVVPGCDSSFHTEVDHIKPVEDYGETVIDNLQTLCTAHHRMKTYKGFDMRVVNGRRVWQAA